MGHKSQCAPMTNFTLQWCTNDELARQKTKRYHGCTLQCCTLQSWAMGYPQGKDHVNTIQVWFKALVTKEDQFFVHKLLAFSCLASFVWRLSLSGYDKDMGFRNYPFLTVPTIILHLGLNLSSFIFHIPSRRIKSGYRIWGEYRLHSLCFLSRALAIMLLYHLEETLKMEAIPILNLVIILATMALGDLASNSAGKYHSKSIRELPVPAWVKFFFSSMQFFGATGLLLGFPERRYTTPFWHCIVIQGNAFLMTVRRKNLSSQTGLLSIYAVGLVSGLTATIIELIPHDHWDLRPFLAATTISCSIAFLRFGGLVRLVPQIPGTKILQSKYLLWTLFGSWWVFVLRPMLLKTDKGFDGLLVGALVSVVALLGLGFYMCQEKVEAKSAKSG